MGAVRRPDDPCGLDLGFARDLAGDRENAPPGRTDPECGVRRAHPGHGGGGLSFDLSDWSDGLDRWRLISGGAGGNVPPR